MKNKKFVCFMLALIVSFGLAACKDSSNSDAPEISPSSAVYELFSGDEVTFELNLKNFTFTSVMRGETALTIRNYKISNDTLTIHADYLKTLQLGKQDFTLVFSGGTTAFSITVVNTKEPFIAQPNPIYNRAEGRKDLDVRIDLKGLQIERVTYGSKDLVVDEEYVTDDAGLSLLADYLYNLPVGKYTFVVYTPGGSIDFTVRII